MLYSDSRGVGEALNETGQNGDGLIIRGRHYVILDHYLNSTIDHRLLGKKSIHCMNKNHWTHWDGSLISLSSIERLSSFRGKKIAAGKQNRHLSVFRVSSFMWQVPWYKG